MKIFKYLFFLILIAFIGGAIYVSTIDGDYQVEERMQIQVPAEMAFDEVNNLKNWEQWDPWQEQDPNRVITYHDKTTGNGAGFSWQGNKFADGSLETVKVVPKKIIQQQRMLETRYGKSTSNLYWKFESDENNITTVTWGIKGELTFWGKAYQTLQDSTANQILPPVISKGLKNLKQELLKKMEHFSVSVDGVTQHSGGFYMYSSTASKNTGKALFSKTNQIIPQVQQYMEENNIQKSGSPMTVYNTIDKENGTVIISSGVPTSNKVTTPEESPVLCGYLESHKVVKVSLKGNYVYLKEAWAAAENYIEKQSYKKHNNAPPYEVYSVGSEEVANPTKWLTELYIPIADTVE